MKLPAEGEVAEGEVSSGSGERQEGNAETTRAAEGAEVSEANGSGSTNGSEVQRSGEPDFSEFLWMEHEDEYDEQVLKELEDEEMINYYFEMYEDSVEEGRNPPNRPPNNSRNQYPQPYHQQAGAIPPGCMGRGGGTPRGRYPPASEPVNDVDDITRGMDRVGFQARLNPDAAEFVPRGSSSAAGNASESNDCPPPDTQPC